MTTTAYRTALIEALHLLESSGNIEQAKGVLRKALNATHTVPQMYLDDITRDDGLQHAISNAADPNAVYFRVDPITGETDDAPVLLNRGDDLDDDERMASPGL